MRKLHPSKMTAIAGLTILGLIATLTACSSDPDGPGVGCETPDGLVLVVGAHESVSKPALPLALQCPLSSAIEAGKPIGIVRLDGAPAVAMPGQVFEITPASTSETLRGDDIAAATATVTGIVAQLAPQADGNDVYAAFGLAVDLARSSDMPTATIYIVDSGLADLGPVNLTVPGALGADPAEYVEYLDKTGQLVDADGVTVIPVSFGYAVPPQQELSADQRAAVIDLHTAVLTASGATVGTPVTAPRTNPGPDTKHRVLPVELPAITPPTFEKDQTLTFDSTSAIKFVANSTTLIDPDAASAELSDLATHLKNSPNVAITITGTTASYGSDESRLTLGKERADTIAALLQAMGVGNEQMSTLGCVHECPGTIPDVLPGGALDPAAAAINRAIHIQIEN